MRQREVTCGHRHGAIGQNEQKFMSNEDALIKFIKVKSDWPIMRHCQPMNIGKWHWLIVSGGQRTVAWREKGSL